jgi:tetratricopeptide (TPR) repeat protein
VVAAPTPSPTPAPAPTPSEPAPAPTPAAKPPAPTAAAPEPAPEPAATPEEPNAAPRPRGKTLGGRKVVLEYDPKPTAPEAPSASAPIPAGENPDTVARAREAYHRGNQKLFTGDYNGAIALYRQSLKIYPGYVAGYRGLGLAYSEEGNGPEALAAFKKYIATVPNARDVPLIRKHMERFEK